MLYRGIRLARPLLMFLAGSVSLCRPGACHPGAAGAPAEASRARAQRPGGTGGQTGSPPVTSCTGGPGKPCSLVKNGDLKPNIVFIVADDLGWGDISLKGGKTKTPNIDKLFADGIEMTTFMVNPVCSPTRSALMTGRNASLLGISDTLGVGKGEHMSTKENTIADALHAQGYKTAVYGKWHLGPGPFDGVKPAIDAGPLTFGFDVFYGHYGAATDYLTRDNAYTEGIKHGLVNEQGNWAKTDAGYTTDMFTKKGVDFINASKPAPFFLYMAYNSVHIPLPVPNASPKDPYLTAAGGNAYSALILGLDNGVRQIVAAIDAAGLGENTIIFFTSDNGPTSNGSALPFKGGKHDLWEGGVHVPAVFRWKGKFTAGDKITRLIGVEDIFQTVLSISGNPIPPAYTTRDGIDVSYNLGAEREAATRPDGIGRSFDWKIPVYSYRTEQYKIIEFTRGGTKLYDLKVDLSESRNIAGSNAIALSTMKAKLSAWKNTLPPANPNPNP